MRSDRPRTLHSSRSAKLSDPSVVMQNLARDSVSPETARELRHKLLSFFRSPTYKPPVLPSIALELTELTRRANVSYEDVAHVVEKDPLIVASVVKLAQSPLYGGRLPVHSLKDALSRVGINTLRDMVWQVVVTLRVFRARGYTSTIEQLQSHSVATAYAARIVAARAGVQAEHAFLCGLLHDVGWSGALVAISDNEKNPPDLGTVFAAIDKIHAEAGRAMATLWGLAPEIVSVIGQHHDLDGTNQPSSMLVPVLCVAEQLAAAAGFGIGLASGEEATEDPLVDQSVIGSFEQAVALLRIEDKLDAIRLLVGEAAERLRSTSSLDER
jgi:putative nucleotidyltransferase with HDIG domain